MTEEQIEAELRLFKAYSQVYEDYPIYTNTCSVEQGILYTATVSENIKSRAEILYGIKPEQWNNTFHKSFSTVIDTPIEKLMAQQLIHYFTTYGFESIGLYDSELVYIPHEKLEIPELEEDIALTVIRYITEEELTNSLMVLLSSGIALSKKTIADILCLADYIDKEKFDEIKNREIRIALYDRYGIVPKNNMEFLRYVVYKLTGSTLYIQSNEMIHQIQNADVKKKYDYLFTYIHQQYGYKKLAEIYRRNKKIFLAFKVKDPETKLDKSVNHIINKISRMSADYHKPIVKDILDNLNSLKSVKVASENRELLLNELDKVTVFREVRILNSLNYKLFNYGEDECNPIVYRIRNGKVYAKDKNAVLIYLRDLIKEHLVERLTPIFCDKLFYIPNNVCYVVPTSEKQFIGNIPEGSYIELPRKSNLVVGVHWTNLKNDKSKKEERIDLDLKMMNLTEHYGWNAAYLSRSGDAVFSGDVTDAPSPKGATELFLIASGTENKSFLIKLNDFTQSKNEVPFEFIVAEIDDKNIYENYMVDPNKVLFSTHSSFEKVIGTDNHATKTLGYVVVEDEAIKIYFKNFEDVKGRVSSPDEVNKNVFNYTDRYSKTQLTLNELIDMCGGDVVDKAVVEYVKVGGRGSKKNVQKSVDYNLATDVLTKDSIIKLFQEV